MMETLLRPGLDDQTRLRTLISLAELHFGHGLMTEGLSILSEVQGPEVPPAHDLRAAALELALGLFDPLQHPLTERAQELLQPAHGKWPDQPLMLTLSELRAGDCAAAAPSLRHSFERLQRFPAAAREQVLPLLLECAIDERQWRVARDIAASFAEHPGLHDGPALHFLLGKVAEFGQEPLAAFDSYALAQGSDGIWGHRARRALVDLGLQHEALSSAEAAELLASEVELWRGDDFAAATLSDLAALQEMAGDAPAAVESLGRLMQRHPGAPEAVVALSEARRLIDGLYAQGAAGEISLSGFMVLHARIAPWFRFTQGYARASELFADTFLAAGATMIAAREYASIRGHLIAAQDLGLHEPLPGQLQRLAVKEAEAMLGGGQFDALGMFLAEPPKIDDPDLAHRLALVSARYLAETRPARGAAVATGAGGPGTGAAAARPGAFRARRLAGGAIRLCRSRPPHRRRPAAAGCDPLSARRPSQRRPRHRGAAGRPVRDPGRPAAMDRDRRHADRARAGASAAARRGGAAAHRQRQGHARDAFRRQERQLTAAAVSKNRQATRNRKEKITKNNLL